ncbi:MAG TPA: hypothetical protein VKP59_04960 [Candidatus Thermoplasmatota archaeon]|nr:hypothetical protein [Candidatus Thermoplasmatota archaeon]
MKTVILQKITSICFVILFIVLSFSPSTHSFDTNNSNDSLWTSFPGSFRFTPSFPDVNSRYDIFSFFQDTGSYDCLKITGEYPFCRYFSFTLYDENTSTDFSSLHDAEIIPDNHHFNPFYLNTSRDVSQRNYTIWLIKEGVSPPDQSENVLILPRSFEKIQVFYRLYRPDKNSDSFGNVSLPQIEAVNRDLSPGVLPKSTITPKSLFLKIRSLFFKEDLINIWDLANRFSEENVWFYRIDDQGLYPSSDNEYIIAPLTQDYFNKIAVITVDSPSFEHTLNGEEFTGDSDVRYWSLSIGGLGLTSTAGSLCDDQLKMKDDGSVTVLIAPGFLTQLLSNNGYNVLPWGGCYKPLLIYRQMLANESFLGNIKRIPSIPRPPTVENQTMDYFADHGASQFIGDYCPQVELCTLPQFFLSTKFF